MKLNLLKLLILLPLIFLTGCGPDGGNSDALEDATEDEIQDYLDMIEAQDAKTEETPELGQDE